MKQSVKDKIAVAVAATFAIILLIAALLEVIKNPEKSSEYKIIDTHEIVENTGWCVGESCILTVNPLTVVPKQAIMNAKHKDKNTIACHFLEHIILPLEKVVCFHMVEIVDNKAIAPIFLTILNKEIEQLNNKNQ